MKEPVEVLRRPQTEVGTTCAPLSHDSGDGVVRDKPQRAALCDVAVAPLEP